MTTAVLVSAAAGVGAVLRLLVDRWVQGRHAAPLPWGTFAVNVSGSLLAGLAVGLGQRGELSADAVLVLTAGLAGGFTTLSTWAWETLALTASAGRAWAVLNVVGTLTGCVAAAAAGWALAAP